MKKANLQWLVILFFVGYSCSVPLTELIYLEGAQQGFTKSSGNIPETYRIRPHDLLYIQVSGEDPGTTSFLNLTESSGNTRALGNLDLITYEVDAAGTITPLHLEKIRVEGLTAEEVSEIISKEVNHLIGSSSVFVKLVERNFTVLGEVRNPGRHPMLRNQVTLFEALGAAGDLTDFGNRKRVKVMRETREGTAMAYLDLTDPGVISSPWYTIQPHDIIYVEPRSGVYGKKTMPFGTVTTLAFSGMYTLLLLITILK